MKLRQNGFTLIEAVIVILITSIIVVAIAVFIQAPIRAYKDTARRAEMVDIVDTSLRRIGRDLRIALPNSVRVAGGGQVIELLLTRNGGRYRAEGTDSLNFTAADTSFDILGPSITFSTGDQIVVYNLGVTGADAYSGNTASTDNRRAYNGVVGSAVTNVQITSANRFPFESASKRFQVVEGPVTYICDLVGGTLYRYSGYPITASQTSVDTDAELMALAGVQRSLMAKNVSACQFTYDASVAAQRSGLVTLRLTLTQQNESVSLYHSVHVNNVP
jgi:MSHA biogenesis protein MshO